MAKATMHDLVIVLPGITGSVLRERRAHGEVDVWALSGQALWQALQSRGDALHKLRLPAHDPRREVPDTALHATALVDDFHGIFGLWRIDGYSRTVQSLLDFFALKADRPDGVVEDANLIAFPYDWRLSNRVSARALQALVQRRLPAYRAHTANPFAKVVLIAHSMGGLVSRYWLEVLGGWEHCRALVTFGTPYRGAVDALNYLANGLARRMLGRTLFDMSDIVRSCPAAYELLPCYEMLKAGDRWIAPAAAEGLPAALDPVHVAAARDFHAEIAEHVEINRREPAYLKSPYLIFPVVGVRQPTLNSATLDGGTIRVSELRPDWLERGGGEGDGTVPRYSAAPPDRADDQREIFFAERHGSLQCNEHVLTHLVERLQNLQMRRPRPMQGGVAAPPAVLALRVEPLVLAGEPVELVVEAEGIEPFGAPRATVTARHARNASPRRLPFVRTGDTWTLTLGDLDAGQYAVVVDTATAGAGAPTPVHEVIEVAGSPA